MAKAAKTPLTVDEALERFWVDRSQSGHMPDYTRITNWVVEREKAATLAGPLPLHSETSANPPNPAASQLLRLHLAPESRSRPKERSPIPTASANLTPNAHNSVPQPQQASSRASGERLRSRALISLMIV